MEKMSKETKQKFKGKEAWVTMYEGHEIKIVNKLKARMYIDGVEVAKEKGVLLKTHVTLSAEIPDTDKIVIATVSGSGKADDVTLKCNMIIGAKVPVTHGVQNKEGVYSEFTPEEEELFIQIKKERNAATDDATLAAIIANL